MGPWLYQQWVNWTQTVLIAVFLMPVCSRAFKESKKACTDKTRESANHPALSK